jgi:hypothetical protein
MHLGCGLVVIACLVHLPGVYATMSDDPRRLARELIAKPTPQDLLVIATTPADVVIADVELLRVARHISPFDCKVVTLTGPASPDALKAAPASRLVFVITRGRALPAGFPDSKLLDAKAYAGLGFIWTLDMRNRTSGGQSPQ